MGTHGQVRPIVFVESEVVVEIGTPEKPDWCVAGKEHRLVENSSDVVLGELHALQQNTLSEIHEEWYRENCLKVRCSKGEHAQSPKARNVTLGTIAVQRIRRAHTPLQEPEAPLSGAHFVQQHRMQGGRL